MSLRHRSRYFFQQKLYLIIENNTFFALKHRINEYQTEMNSRKEITGNLYFCLSVFSMHLSYVRQRLKLLQRWLTYLVKRRKRVFLPPHLFAKISMNKKKRQNKLRKSPHFTGRNRPSINLKRAGSSG